MVDSGFRPNPHGYSFENYGQSQYESTDLDAGALIGLFGAANVCQTGTTAANCVLNAAERTWREKANQGMNGGHCAGLAMTSQRFFANYDQATTFDPHAPSVFGMGLSPAVSNHIAQWFTVQSLEPADGSGAGDIAGYLEKTPNDVLDIMRQYMQNHPTDILYLAIYSAEGGHAVNPYAIADKGGGIFWVYIYDNNWPNQERYIVHDTNANTWLYNFAATNPGEQAGAWPGDATTKTEMLRPASALNKPLWACPFCTAPALTSN